MFQSRLLSSYPIPQLLHCSRLSYDTFLNIGIFSLFSILMKDEVSSDMRIFPGLVLVDPFIFFYLCYPPIIFFLSLQLFPFVVHNNNYEIDFQESIKFSLQKQFNKV